MSTPSTNDRPLSLLIVDDNRDVADSLSFVLRNCGYDVSIAYDGTQAVTMVNESVFSVILCDIGLPGRSGYEVASEIRRLRGKTPLLVAVSAYSTEGVVQQARESGFDHFFSKPADPKALEALIRNYKAT